MAQKIFIYDQPHTRAILQLEEFRTKPRSFGSAHFMLITGPTGTGKTQLLERYAGRFDQKSSPRRDTMTVALAPLQGVTKGVDLAHAVIKTLYPPKRRPPADIRDGLNQVKALAASRETEVIVIDKAERLCLGNRIDPAAEEFLCEILDKRIVGTLVLAGDTIVKEVIDANVTLETMVHKRIILEHLGFEDDATAEHRRKQNQARSANGLEMIPLARDGYVHFLSKLAKALPLWADGLSTEGMAERFFIAVGGNRRAIMNLVYGAVEYALKRSADEGLASEHLAAAFADTWPDRLNPFLTVEPPKAHQAPPPLHPDLVERFWTIVGLNR